MFFCNFFILYSFIVQSDLLLYILVLLVHTNPSPSYYVFYYLTDVALTFAAVTAVNGAGR